MTHIDAGEQTVARVERCSATLDMFDAPDPPTGPKTDTDHRIPDSKDAAFGRWIATEDGRHFMAYAEAEALTAYHAGDRRWSALGYMHVYRATHKRPVNNTFAPFVADELVARHPELLNLIERRERKGRG